MPPPPVAAVPAVAVPAVVPPGTAVPTASVLCRIARLAAAVGAPPGSGAAFVVGVPPDVAPASPDAFEIVASAGVWATAVPDALDVRPADLARRTVPQAVAAAAVRVLGWPSAAAVPLPDPAGAPIAVLVARGDGCPTDGSLQAHLTDLVALAAAAGASREAPAHLEALAAHGTDLFALVDREGYVQYASPAALRALGQATAAEAPDAVLGRRVLDLVHPADVPQAAALFAAVCDTPGSRRNARLRLECLSGEVRTFDVVATNQLSDPGLGAVALSARDVTAAVALEARLGRLQAIEAASSATHALAHDVTNALAVIGTSARLAREGLADVAPDASRRSHVDADLHEIEAEVRRAAALARRLVDAGRGSR